MPLLVKVDPDRLYLRHLLHGEHAGHPSEILWMLDAIRERYHMRLDASRAITSPCRGCL
jgi:hypothetical protein